MELSEAFADALLSFRELKSAAVGARAVGSVSLWQAAWAASEAAGTDAWQAATWVPAWAAEAVAESAARTALERDPAAPRETVAATAWLAERHAQCDLLREIVGNPFQPAVIKPSCLVWKNGCVVRNAQAIYEARRFDDLPHLGQVLEQAGCDDPAIIDHCRQLAGHVRGCWVLDLLLGKRWLRENDCTHPFYERPVPGSYLSRFVPREGWLKPPESALQKCA